MICARAATIGRVDRRLNRRLADAPTVAGSHMNQPRLPTPRLHAPRDRSNEKPGDVSIGFVYHALSAGSDVVDSGAKLAERRTIRQTYYSATAATVVTTGVVSSHRSSPYQNSTGIAPNASSAQASSALKKAGSTL